MFRFFLLILISGFTYAHGADNSYGTIRGKISHAFTKQALAGVNITLVETVLGASTDMDGEYVIERVPAGIYTVKIEYIGFEPVQKTDIIVRPGRILFINGELRETAIETEIIEIHGGYFLNEPNEALGKVAFNAEEIRRAPGSAGDISRLLKILPGAAQVTDNANDLMIRGGSPSENGFLVDHIYIPNINHFPVQGASGGAIGLLNVDFIEDVSFYTAGFSPEYGDKLSSILAINFREGNREEIDGQIDLGMAGIGAILEGPLPGKQGSWIFSGRRSYLDFIAGSLGLGGMVPQYGDVHAKIVFEPNPQNKIILLNIFGTNAIAVDQEQAVKDNNSLYGDVTNHQNTIGLSWRRLWSKQSYSQTALSYSFISRDDIWYNTKTNIRQQENNYLEGTVHLRNSNYVQLQSTQRLEFGWEASYEFDDYDYFLNGFTNRLGDQVPAFKLNDDWSSYNAAMFANYIYTPLERWSYSTGVRLDYNHFNGQIHVSPRLSTTYALSKSFTFNAAYGIYYQRLPRHLLAQKSDYDRLKDAKAVHYVMGISHQWRPDTRLTLEIYDKEYYHLPLDPSDPYLFVIDDGSSSRYFGGYRDLVDTGRARSYGLEFMIQKKLTSKFYGSISSAFFRSLYRDYNGTWRPRDYDNRLLFTLNGGYRPSKRWEFSAHWTFAGGIPYTPFDQQLSTEQGAGIIDRNRVNQVRRPSYHALNLRLDRRFFFKQSALVTYFSIWNAYNRKNVALYYWNELENRQRAYYQWSFFPLLGFEFEF